MLVFPIAGAGSFLWKVYTHDAISFRLMLSEAQHVISCLAPRLLFPITAHRFSAKGPGALRGAFGTVNCLLSFLTHLIRGVAPT